MKVKEVIAALSKQDPELDVLFQDPNSGGGPFGVGRITACESEGEFPDDFDMPEGFKYVLLQS